MMPNPQYARKSGVPTSPVRPPSAPVPPAALDALADALVMERKLVDELTAVMLRQRNAVATDDVQAVDDSVFATHRLLLTLGEARKRRRSINRILGCQEETGVKQLEDALGPWMTPQLRAVREELQGAARTLSREIETNRRILREAIANSESLVRTIVGAPKDATHAGYGTPLPTAYTRSDTVAISRTA